MAVGPLKATITPIFSGCWAQAGAAVSISSAHPAAICRNMVVSLFQFLDGLAVFLDRLVDRNGALRRDAARYKIGNLSRPVAQLGQDLDAVLADRGRRAVAGRRRPVPFARYGRLAHGAHGGHFLL